MLGRIGAALNFLLAPDIQEEILFMETENGEEPISERMLEAIVRESSWDDQRKGLEATQCATEMTITRHTQK